jgi:hypothetical protein
LTGQPFTAVASARASSPAQGRLWAAGGLLGHCIQAGHSGGGGGGRPQPWKQVEKAADSLPSTSITGSSVSPPPPPPAAAAARVGRPERRALRAARYRRARAAHACGGCRRRQNASAPSLRVRIDSAGTQRSVSWWHVLEFLGAQPSNCLQTPPYTITSKPGFSASSKSHMPWSSAHM